jgi:hypothetical protein
MMSDFQKKTEELGRKYQLLSPGPNADEAAHEQARQEQERIGKEYTELQQLAQRAVAAYAPLLHLSAQEIPLAWVEPDTAVGMLQDHEPPAGTRL